MVQSWFKSGDYKDFSVDVSYRSLYLLIRSYNLASAVPNASAADVIRARQSLIDFFPAENQRAAEEIIHSADNHSITYEFYNRLKPLCQPGPAKRFNIRPITYFSMSGIAHTNCLTNLKNVYANGECMHDFGANRVGGLPWGFYLANARIISEAIYTDLQTAQFEEFDVVELKSDFDADLINEIRQTLNEQQNFTIDADCVTQRIEWFRSKRKELKASGKALHDAFSLLIVAEAILLSSACRQESRGYFLRADMPEENPALDQCFTHANYCSSADEVKVSLVQSTSFHTQAG
jgi:4-hydroxybenzoate adenylyltransferase